MNVDRIYKLHEIFRERRTPASTQSLMDRLQCSRSTLHRAIERLRNMGAPILNTPGRGYFYDRRADAFELPGMWLRADELEALLVMDCLLERLEPGLLKHRIGPIKTRLRQHLASVVPGTQQFPLTESVFCQRMPGGLRPIAWRILSWRLLSGSNWPSLMPAGLRETSPSAPFLLSG